MLIPLPTTIGPIPLPTTVLPIALPTTVLPIALPTTVLPIALPTTTTIPLPTTVGPIPLPTIVLSIALPTTVLPILLPTTVLPIAPPTAIPLPTTVLPIALPIKEEYEAQKAAEVAANERLRLALEAPGGMDDIDEDDDDDEAEPSTAARADDVDAELTINEIMEIEPKKMVMNLSEKRMNRYYEGAFGPVENVTLLFETSKVRNIIKINIARREGREGVSFFSVPC